MSLFSHILYQLKKIGYRSLIYLLQAFQKIAVHSVIVLEVVEIRLKYKHLAIKQVLTIL